MEETIYVPGWKQLFMTFESSVPIEMLRKGDSWYSGVNKFNTKPTKQKKKMYEI